METYTITNRESGLTTQIEVYNIGGSRRVVVKGDQAEEVTKLLSTTTTPDGKPFDFENCTVMDVVSELPLSKFKIVLSVETPMRLRTQSERE